MPWTESEHLAFLEGLRNLGKGNWCVPPRPPAPLHAGRRRGNRVASPAPAKFRIVRNTYQKGDFKDALTGTLS